MHEEPAIMVRPAAAAADAADEMRCWRDDEHVIDADTQCVLAPYSKCRPSINNIDTICDLPDNFQRHLLLYLLRYAALCSRLVRPFVRAASVRTTISSFKKYSFWLLICDLVTLTTAIFICLIRREIDFCNVTIFPDAIPLVNQTAERRAASCDC